jgi:hypothetical protein
MTNANNTETDSLSRDDMTKSTTQTSRKPRKTRLYCVLEGTTFRRISRFHTRKVAERAVRLARSWGLDAYRSGPVERMA